MRAARRALRSVLVGLVAVAAVLLGWALLHEQPQDPPWTPLDLGEPIGPFTGRELAALSGEFPQCRRLLGRAGVRYIILPPRHAGRCGYDDAIRLTPEGSRRIGFSPAGVGISCPVAAALAMWEWDVVQPAAQHRFGLPVIRIEHFGSYNCRHIRGGASGNWSEHATANAIDVAGFTLADGTRVTVAHDWRRHDSKAAFLRDVRNGACGVFATVLSPDYNAVHADHLHLDQAARGATGWRACR